MLALGARGAAEYASSEPTTDPPTAVGDCVNASTPATRSHTLPPRLGFHAVAWPNGPVAGKTTVPDSLIDQPSVPVNSLAR